VLFAISFFEKTKKGCRCYH